MSFKKNFIKLFLAVFFLFNNIVLSQDTYYKFIGTKSANGDTIPFINLLIQSKWDAVLFQNNKVIAHYSECVSDTITLLDKTDKIILSTIFSIDTSLVNQPLALNYSFNDIFKVKINGLQLVSGNIINHPYSILSNKQHGSVYLSFSKKNNLVEIELHRKDFENLSRPEFQLCTLKWNEQKQKEENQTNSFLLVKIIFFLTIGIVMFIQFFFYKSRKENFYFSLFCILYTFFLINDLVEFSEFIRITFFAFAAIGIGALTNYLSIVLVGKEEKRWATIILIIGVILSFLLSYLISNQIKWAILGLTIIYIAYNFFRCLYLLFQGSIKKKWEAKYISYGFFTALIIYVLFFILLAIFESNKNKSGISIFNYLFEFPIFIIPLTLAIMIGKRNGQNQKELIIKYDEIKVLSEENLKKEKEKQQILAEQNHVLENKVEERTREINLQKHIVEEKQKEIIESINYAKRLQQAILPPIELIKGQLPESFVLYKPKDIIAGDFYWMETIQDMIFIASADCTGHGVPGAMVSVVCSNALNRSVKEFGLTETGRILDKTRELVLETFEKSVNEVKDGMDISLLCIDKNNKQFFWSGANNPLWYIQNNELQEIKADKQPIGKTDYAKPFTTHKVSYDTETVFYLFTDGYADQFGGPKGKKFKYKPMQELLISIQQLSMEEQADIINKTFNDWKNELEQVDDVCIIGIKI
jgi:serine phosphatase RsbU (regulator of sigma subunit)